MNPLIVAQGLLIYGLLAWKLTHLFRAPHDIPLRWVVACLGCAAAAYPVEILFVPRSASPDSRWLMVTQCSLLLGVIYSLGGFFLSSLLTPPEAARRTAGRAVALLAAAALMAAAAAAVPAGDGMSDRAVPAVAAAYLVFNISMALFLADSLRWTLRGTAQAPPHVARGLRLTSAGIIIMLAGLVPLTAIYAADAAWGTPPRVLGAAGQLIVILGILAFLAGLCYPGAVMRLGNLRRWSRHRRAYQQLGPLWTELNRSFPQDALARVPPARWRDALSPWSVHRRYYRRVIECRDGLVRISPHLSPHADGSPATLGEQVVTALRSVGADALIPRQAMRIAVPESGGLDADADELVRLSRQVAAARAGTAGQAAR